jgi:transcriptional regulator with XRE-family HTH domain
MPSRSPQAGKSHRALGLAIRELRQRQNLTQRELAELAGWHATDISSLESGRRNPTLNALQQVSHALGVRASEMLVLAESIERREAESQTR